MIANRIFETFKMMFPDLARNVVSYRNIPGVSGGIYVKTIKCEYKFLYKSEREFVLEAVKR